jgi:hypothetical protein
MAEKRSIPVSSDETQKSEHRVELKPPAPKLETDIAATPSAPPLNMKKFNAMEGFSAPPLSTKPKAAAALSKEETKSELAADDPVNIALDDKTTEQAIEDIVLTESNQVLADQDAAIEAQAKPAKPEKKRFSIKKLLKNKWFYFSLGLILIVIFALPYTRYRILGLFLDNQFELRLVDSTTGTPVSGADVTINGQTKDTNGSGEAAFKLKLGSHNYKITKQYYRNAVGQVFVGLEVGKPTTLTVSATGRRVPIKVIDKLSSKPIANASIKILNTNARTDSTGMAYVVLPTSSSVYLATVSASAYNAVTTRVSVATKTSANTISLVPSGNIYFLSTTGSSINVIKASLDGSDPQVLEANVASAKSASTALYASPDQKYLVLEATRGGSQPELYVINAASGQLTEFDSSSDAFSPIGWSGDQFIYDETNSSADPSTVGREQIKSYNATNQQLNVLDQNQVNGTIPNYAYQSFFNFELLSNVLVYNTKWTASGSVDLSSSSDTIRGIEPNGLGKKDYQSFPATTTGTINVTRYQPNALYFSVPNASTNHTTYYNYTNGAANTDSSLTAANFNQSYPKYFISPSALQSLWTQSTNGQPQTFVGDQNGQNQKLVSLPAGYSAIGWYDNVYIMLSKNNQLYLAASTGTTHPELIGNFVANP